MLPFVIGRPLYVFWISNYWFLEFVFHQFLRLALICFVNIWGLVNKLKECDILFGYLRWFEILYDFCCYQMYACQSMALLLSYIFCCISYPISSYMIFIARLIHLLFFFLNNTQVKPRCFRCFHLTYYLGLAADFWLTTLAQ